MTDLTHSLPDRAPPMAGPSARGGHDGQVIPARVAAISFERHALMDDIAVLRFRHRRRRALQKLLAKLTTQQLDLENKLDDREAKRKAA